MARFVPFISVRRKNIAHRDSPDLYYAFAKASRDVDIEEMSERIERASTVNATDVVAVLHALETEMMDCFKLGEIVRLGKIGSFQVSLRSSGVADQKDVKESVIRNARICFRPGNGIKDVLKTLSYGKVSVTGEKAPTDPDNPAPDPGGNDGGGEAPDPLG